MSLAKNWGPVSLNEAGGVVTVSIAASESVGGGGLAGVVKASLSAQAQISVAQLVDAALAAAADKWPGASAEVAVLKGLVDAELAKI